jgi:hypothetical protein
LDDGEGKKLGFFDFTLSSVVYTYLKVAIYSNFISSKTSALFNDGLSRPCDACGKPIGGGYRHCPKCKIYFCWYCGIVLMQNSKELPVKCPMCGEMLI